MNRVIRNDASHKGITEDEVRVMYSQSISMGVFIKSEEIANLVMFICSKAGQAISGQALCIDGNIEILR